MKGIIAGNLTPQVGYSLRSTGRAGGGTRQHQATTGTLKPYPIENLCLPSPRALKVSCLMTCYGFLKHSAAWLRFRAHTSFDKNPLVATVLRLLEDHITQSRQLGFLYAPESTFATK